MGELDELFFRTLVPSRVQEIVRSLQPVPYKPFTCRGVDLWPFVLVVLLLVFRQWIVFFELAPFWDKLESVMAYLCGGYTDFVFDVYLNGTLRFFDADTSPFVANPGEPPGIERQMISSHVWQHIGNIHDDHALA